MDSPRGQPVDFWHLPALIQPNKFKFKSLSSWSFNISVGCSHACRFCYVPSVATNKAKPDLERYGVKDPDAEWGGYSLLRLWDERKFLISVRKAEQTDLADLKADGNRAVIYCSTTDPYQVYRAAAPAKSRELNEAARQLVRRSLELILEESTLNVRILTRSPLARRDFDLYRKFGSRLLFGMSLPTLDNELARIYEPHAPAPDKRLETLRAARDAGLNVYVAMAPTYPECDEADLRRTLNEIEKLEPHTVFHEPINMRAENVRRIEDHARMIGKKIRTGVFASRGSWVRYALESLQTVERLAHELGMIDRLHLWPDQGLGESKSFFAALKCTPGSEIKFSNLHEEARWQTQNSPAYEKCKAWINGWHNRISEWPGQGGARNLGAPASVGRQRAARRAGGIDPRHEGAVRAGRVRAKH